MFLVLQQMVKKNKNGKMEMECPGGEKISVYAYNHVC